MDYLKKLGKIILFIYASIIISSLILNTLYYFDIINSNIYNILKMSFLLIILFIASFILGKKSSKYGIIEGLKIGGIFIFFMFIIKLLTNTFISTKTLLYSIIIILTTCIGAIIGINKKDN